MKGRGKRAIPVKTRRPTALSGTIPTCENPVTRPGIGPGSPRWEASVLIAQPPRPYAKTLIFPTTTYGSPKIAFLREFLVHKAKWGTRVAAL
ncbi:hypothetical protein PR048_018526 [Dryococelus australis]|uniref:Uncharacterized protein n=1 Tax=Dryococelus australis TaxID=614101 RepID=A0ABQ9HD87_9NEOP|nr:hypothetical protein PR048_018526 [Dryococelus australis]